MLGLRKSLNARRKRRNSNSSSLNSIEENTPAPRAAMDTLRKNLTSPIANLVSHQSPKPSDAAQVAVAELQMSDEESEPTNSLRSHRTSHGSADANTTVTSASSGVTTTFLGHFTRFREVIKDATGIICKFPAWEPTHVENTTIHSYLQFIDDERLMHMPRRGSDWDRVLRAARLFGVQIWSFAERVDTFAPNAKASVPAALASCKAMLNLGHGQAKALLPTFICLYELAMILSTVGQATRWDDLPASVLEHAANVLCDLVVLVANISSYYNQKAAQLHAGHSVSISFDAAFGKQVDDLWQSKIKFVERVWAAQLGSKGSVAGLRRLRRKLGAEPGSSSSSSSVRNILYDEVAEQLDRSEHTCHWFRDSLAQFLSNDDAQCLNVSGAPGSGKTILAEWVQERLARPLQNRSYIVLNYNFPFDSPRNATGLACVKSLLSQLLESSIGSVELYQDLEKAFSQKEIEPALWGVLRNGLRAIQKTQGVVILTDGCDSIAGDSGAPVKFHKTLQAAVKGLSKTKVITFSRPVTHLSAGCEHHIITEKNIQRDISVHLEQTAIAAHHFSAESADELIESLSAKSKGSFLWAFLAGRLLVHEKTDKEAIALSKKLNSSVSDVIHKVLSHLNLKDKTLRELLSFMVITEEALAVDQVVQLFGVDVSKRTLVKSAIENVTRYVKETCSELVIVRGGRLHLRSAGIRDLLKEQMGKALLSYKDAHRQLTLRMLLYARLSLNIDQDIIVDDLEGTFVENLLGAHHLLRYVMANWVFHFQQCGFTSTSGDISLPDEFVHAFPSSIVFGLLEASSWRGVDTAVRASWHKLSLKISKKCLGEKHSAVLQRLIILGRVHSTLDIVEAGQYFYHAVKLGQLVLPVYSSVLLECTSLFLKYTETIVITKRTTMVTHREEMIRYIITLCKRHYGESSDKVISWYETLAKLYIDIKEEEHAVETHHELHKIIIKRFGKNSSQARSYRAVFDTLDIVLKGDEAEKHIGELIFETGDELDITDRLSISLLIRWAQSYVSCGKLFLAERLYVSIWRRLSIICKDGSSHGNHILRIQIAIEYAKFLRHVKREAEAANILICLWAEYEHFKCEEETLMVWIREIGVLCKGFGLLSVAISILKRVWGWFKGKGKAEDEEAQKTTILITEVVEEITEKTTETKTTTVTTTTVEETETVTREIFEIHLERCRKTKADKHFFSACLALVGVYFKTKKWAEAEVVIKRTLEITWKAIFSADIHISICEDSVTECVLVARRLADCYLHQGSFEMAEKIYLKIYYACLESLTIEDVRLQETITVLISLYEKHHRHDKIIGVYLELLARYRKHLGHTHKLTIGVLYLLAAQYEMIGRKEAYEYYLEIVTVLGKGHKHCHHDAWNAAVILLRHYHVHKKYAELRGICVAMWETICRHRDEIVISEEIIALVYEKYRFVLEIHVKVEFSVLYTLSVEYREVIKTVFGEASSGYLLALIALAEVCEKSEEHYHESVTIYEEVIKRTKITKTTTTTTTVTETTTKTVTKRLSKLYVTIITSGKDRTTTTVDKALELSLEALLMLKREFGCWHEKTLLKVKDVVVLYQVLKTKEAHYKIVQLLQGMVLEIITSKASTMDLFTAAKTLASIYLSASLTSEGLSIVHQLRHILLFRDRMPGSVTIELGSHVSKLAFTFLIAFEQSLTCKTEAVHYSEFMAEIVLESLLFEEYTRIVEAETKLVLVLECGARLRSFWEERGRQEFLEVLDQKLLHLLMKEYGAHWKGLGDAEVREFYLWVLAELAIDRPATALDFDTLALRSGNDRVKALILKGEFKMALQLSQVIFSFASKQKLYHTEQRIQYGYQLAGLLAGIDLPLPKDSKYRQQSLESSRRIMKEVLTAFDAANIDFLSRNRPDLDLLIRLLGAQQNYVKLECLLTKVWKAREKLQKQFGWSSAVVISVGKQLVHAQHLSHRRSTAIDTAELLYYNLKRSSGKLDKETLDVAELLADLYSREGRQDKAMDVHEGVLREMGSVCKHAAASSGDNKPSSPTDAFSATSWTNRHTCNLSPTQFKSFGHSHLSGLRKTHGKLEGWPKAVKEYKSLIEDVREGLGLKVRGLDEWVKGGDGTEEDEKVLVHDFGPKKTGNGDHESVPGLGRGVVWGII